MNREDGVPAKGRIPGKDHSPRTPRRGRVRARARRPPGEGEMPFGISTEINMTPMIDVMMALLIIFMVITPVLTRYTAELPRATHVVPAVEDDVVQVGIDASGRLWIGEDAVDPADLPAHLAALYAGRPGDHLLYLRADRGVAYERVLDVVDAARAAGVRQIAAITEPIAPAATAVPSTSATAVPSTSATPGPGP